MPKKLRRSVMKKGKKKEASRLSPGPSHTPPELLSPSPMILDQNAFAKVHDEALREHLAGLSEPADLIKAGEQFVNSLMAWVLPGNTPAISTLALSHLAARLLQALFARVSMGDHLAARRVYGILRSSVEQLISDCMRNPSTYLDVAKANLQSPVLYSPHPNFSTDVNALQSKLKVADGYRLNVFGGWSDRKRGVDLDLPQNWLAFTILEKLISARSAVSATSDEEQEPKWQKDCKQLPPLSSETADAWARVGWKAVLHYYRDHPESDPFLAQMGNSLVDLKTEGRVRGRIQTQFTTAIRKLARPSYATP